MPVVYNTEYEGIQACILYDFGNKASDSVQCFKVGALGIVVYGVKRLVDVYIVMGSLSLTEINCLWHGYMLTPFSQRIRPIPWLQIIWLFISTPHQLPLCSFAWWTYLKLSFCRIISNVWNFGTRKYNWTICIPTSKCLSHQWKNTVSINFKFLLNWSSNCLLWWKRSYLL